jgi:hypothetical protein
VGEFKSFSKTDGISVGLRFALAGDETKVNTINATKTLLNLNIETFIGQRRLQY